MTNTERFNVFNCLKHGFLGSRADFAKTCNDVNRDGFSVTFMLIALRTNGVGWAQSIPWWMMFIPPAVAFGIVVAAAVVERRWETRGWLVLAPLILVNLGIIITLMSGRLNT